MSLLFLYIFFALVLKQTANGHSHSFSGVMKNYSALLKRESQEWYLIAWDEKEQINKRHRFDKDDPFVYPYPKLYCMVHGEMAADFEVDAYPLGDTLPIFGAPEKYNPAQYEILKEQTKKSGIILNFTKIKYSLQNMAILDNAWDLDINNAEKKHQNISLVLWRSRDPHRLDKVIYCFADKNNNYKQIPDSSDWIEYRNRSNLSGHWPFIGEDMRIMKSIHTGKIYANWVTHYQGNMKFYYGELKLPPPTKPEIIKRIESNNNIDDRNWRFAVGTSLYIDYPPISINTNHESTPHDNKNWVMFEYKNTILFIQRIQPMRVVTSIPMHKNNNNDNSNNNLYDHSARSISLTASKNFCWHYGELRGGTSALLVNNGKEYLGFFHSQQRISHHKVRTYFLGAYTFSSKPPFHMLKMSKTPIVIDWPKDFVYQDIDYVPFPMSFTYSYNNTASSSSPNGNGNGNGNGDDEDKRDGTIDLALGWQESDGYILKLDMRTLYDSMRDMDPIVLGQSDEWTETIDGKVNIPWESFQYNAGSAGSYCEYNTDIHSHNCAVVRKRNRMKRRRRLLGGMK
jgi:hypothetical protein